jgi:hypothetical protein
MNKTIQMISGVTAWNIPARDQFMNMEELQCS